MKMICMIIERIFNIVFWNVKNVVGMEFGLFDG